MDTMYSTFDGEHDRTSFCVTDATQLRYCPECGARTVRSARQFAYHVECPTHGHLLVRPP
jgi:predicted RNA-binding Zn-ribbon protein involved in translation (DUF1610 family)